MRNTSVFTGSRYVGWFGSFFPDFPASDTSHSICTSAHTDGRAPCGVPNPDRTGASGTPFASQPLAHGTMHARHRQSPMNPDGFPIDVALHGSCHGRTRRVTPTLGGLPSRRRTTESEEDQSGSDGVGWWVPGCACAEPGIATTADTDP